MYDDPYTSQLVRMLLKPRDKMPPLGSRVVGDTADGRPAYLNPDGSLSTERSITTRHPGINGGAWTNIPTIFDGEHMGEDAAIRRILTTQPSPRGVEDYGKTFDPVTGRRLPGHGSVGAAVEAAQSRSHGMDIEPRPPWRSFWTDGIR